MTQGERLARIETILEGMAKGEAEFRDEVRAALQEIRESAKEHKKATDADQAALEALKNKGVGLLIGVGLAGGAAGAALTKAFQTIFN